jgi:multidrug resistance efflux pump
MKPIIIDANDMSDSREVYEERPNKWLVYTVYAIALIVVMALMWSILFKMDIVVKGQGVFRCVNDASEISCGVTGKIISNKYKDGDYVKKGDVILKIKVDSLSETIKKYENDIKNFNARIEMLNAYENSLEGDEGALKAYRDNKYYEEFLNRRELLFERINGENKASGKQKTSLERNNIGIDEALKKYNDKLEKLKQAENAVTSRANPFTKNDIYYYYLVEGYISSYNYNSFQYDSKIETASNNDGNQGGIGIASLKDEKEQALKKLECQEISSIESQISQIEDSVMKLKTSKTSMEIQNGSTIDGSTSKQVEILTEKGEIEAELVKYQEKNNECQAYLENYDIKNNNCIIKANASGYYYGSESLKQGIYVKEGSVIGAIYPKKQDKFRAEVYIENSEIGKLKDRQKVRFEIASYPSSEYGYFTGKIKDVAEDISVDKSSGKSFYKVIISCDNVSKTGKDGKTVTLKNGMGVQAKIITDKKSVFRYVLEKIDLLNS